MDSTDSWTPQTLAEMHVHNTRAFDPDPTAGPEVREISHHMHSTSLEDCPAVNNLEPGDHDITHVCVSNYHSLPRSWTRTCLPLPSNLDFPWLQSLPDYFASPALAKPQMEGTLTFTPTTLHGMVESRYNPPQEFRLLDLPREVRNLVYAHLLTPSGGFPMDFASCADCIHEIWDYTPDIIYDPDERATSRAWYSDEWARIRSNLRIMTLCHQINSEATGIFYGQHFKFTSDVGWVMLYHFLSKIGPEKRALLRNITVCHPAFSSLPSDCPPRQQTGHLYRDDYTYLFNDHMQAFGLGSCLPQDYRTLSHDPAWLTIGHFDGTLRLLAQAAGLTRLTLVLPQFQRPAEQATLQDQELHPIHTFVWPQGVALKRFVRNLVQSRHDCHRGKRSKHGMQMCLDEIYHRRVEATNTTTMAHIHWLNFSHEKVPRQQAYTARVFFNAVKAAGWIVCESMYDERGTYPVKSGQFCVNKSMCHKLGEVDEPFIWFHCPGNVEEVLDHDDLDMLIAMRDGRLKGLGYFD